MRITNTASETIDTSLVVGVAVVGAHQQCDKRALKMGYTCFKQTNTHTYV